jgi:hypothetical protein
MRLLVAAASLGVLVGCADDPPALKIAGTLERESIERTNESPVDVDYDSLEARGEWWPCDLRLTAQGCIDGFHVNVFLGLPPVAGLDDLGLRACVDDSGEPFGVFEVIQTDADRTLTIGSDVSVFALVASDVTEGAGADLDDDAEVRAASRLTSGTVAIERFTDVEGALALTIDGVTASGRAVEIHFEGPMTNPRVITALESSTSCVDSANKRR